MNQGQADLLGKVDVKKVLIKLSIPATIGMLVNATYNLVDSLFVGWGAGELAIGALTLAFPIQMIVMAVALMIGIGGASVFSRAYGRGDKIAMHHTINTALRFGIASAIVVSILGLLFLDELLVFFDATSENIGFAKQYLSVILIGIVFQTVSMILNNFTRAEGRARVAMTAMVIGTGLNIILDPILIFDWGFGLGVRGAAIATVISQFTSFAYITKAAFAKDSVLTITFKDWFKIEPYYLKEIVKIGLPTFMRNAIGAFLTIIIIKLIAFYTPVAETGLYIAIYGVVNRVLMFVLMPGFGLVQGVAPIAGYNFGAGNWQRLYDLVVFATKILASYFVVGFLLIEFGAGMIFDVFSNSNDVFFIENGTHIFRIVGAGLFLVSFQIITGAIYQAFGYAKRALFISLSRQFIFFLPIAFILTYFFKLDGLWYTFVAADVLSGIVGIIMLAYELRVLKRNIETL